MRQGLGRFGANPRPALRRIWWTMAGCLALAACEEAPIAPRDRLAAEPPAQSQPAQPEPSAESAAERRYYARIQENYLARGLLRGNDRIEDAPFDAEDLARNFLRIAFFDEFVERDGKLVAEPREGRLQRWEGPVRLSVEFGPSVDEAQRRADLAAIDAYAARLARLTGLRISRSDWRPNHLVLILNSDERKEALDRIRAFAPAISPAALQSVRDMARQTYCTVIALSDDTSHVYVSAVTVIRAELAYRMRLACIHEELAQSLGLVNDSPHARPSIFNDNEEFALLTPQDELMLRILYDPRLRPGMTLAEAEPIVRQIARELLPETQAETAMTVEDRLAFGYARGR
ncbi:Protein of unknown function (DUF2927) [Albidovulum inexpectatum]|uniref:DUF2927 family protein n=2 Tax=Albidovulum inexpectatum TaxID=196587 RepID=A0A2S5JFN4_9RHOB|nr:Protein of unknown function (DUF2927) [Albidovulum inexpectatum]